MTALSDKLTAVLANFRNPREVFRLPFLILRFCPPWPGLLIRINSIFFFENFAKKIELFIIYNFRTYNIFFNSSRTRWAGSIVKNAGYFFLCKKIKSTSIIFISSSREKEKKVSKLGHRQIRFFLLDKSANLNY